MREKKLLNLNILLFELLKNGLLFVGCDRQNH